MSAGLHSMSVLRWATLLLGATALWLCWPLWPALVLSAWTASLLRPLIAARAAPVTRVIASRAA